MNDIPIKFVITGHVDHGKSTLIGRLLYDTGSVPRDKVEEMEEKARNAGWSVVFAHLLDHLEEEREEGITIDTTERFFKSGDKHYVIIDAPGHVEFTKNMMTGASRADAAVLIIDALEGIKEQTRRHAHLLHMLGIDQVVVLINKMDLADYDKGSFERIKTGAAKLLELIGVIPLAYIPISALEGENVAHSSDKMKWCEGPTFLKSLEMIEGKASPAGEDFVFPVQDIYKINGKDIVVGRIEGGVISSVDRVKILPKGKEINISSIEKYPKSLQKAQAGESIGITFEDKEVGLKRGDILCKSGAEPVVADSFTANVFWMAREASDVKEPLQLRCSTQEVTSNIETIKQRMDSSSLKEIVRPDSTLRHFEVGKVVIKTDRPIVITPDAMQDLGRFIMVKAGEVCAAGIIRGVN